MTSVPLTGTFIERHGFTTPVVSLGLFTSQGPLQFAQLSPFAPAFAQWTYVNGWPTTTLAATSDAGDTVVVVADSQQVPGETVGIYPGTQLTLYDSQFTEVATIESVSGTTLNTLAPLQFDHATVGISISALPPAVKEACILLTSAFVKSRGREAVVMAAVRQPGPNTTTNDFGGATGDAMLATSILQQFKTVR